MECVSCGKRMHWQDAQNGHFISRGLSAGLVYVERNCGPQCVPCNKWKQGNYPGYRENRVRLYGEQYVLWLEAQRKIALKALATFEMIALIKDLIPRFLEQARRLGYEPTDRQKALIEKWK